LSKKSLLNIVNRLPAVLPQRIQIVAISLKHEVLMTLEILALSTGLFQLNYCSLGCSRKAVECISLRV